MSGGTMRHVAIAALFGSTIVATATNSSAMSGYTPVCYDENSPACTTTQVQVCEDVAPTQGPAQSGDIIFYKKDSPIQKLMAALQGKAWVAGQTAPNGMLQAGHVGMVHSSDGVNSQVIHNTFEPEKVPWQACVNGLTPPACNIRVDYNSATTWLSGMTIDLSDIWLDPSLFSNLTPGLKRESIADWTKDKDEVFFYRANSRDQAKAVASGLNSQQWGQTYSLFAFSDYPSELARYRTMCAGAMLAAWDQQSPSGPGTSGLHSCGSSPMAGCATPYTATFRKSVSYNGYLKLYDLVRPLVSMVASKLAAEGKTLTAATQNFAAQRLAIQLLNNFGRGRTDKGPSGDWDWYWELDESVVGAGNTVSDDDLINQIATNTTVYNPVRINYANTVTTHRCYWKDEKSCPQIPCP